MKGLLFSALDGCCLEEPKDQVSRLVVEANMPNIMLQWLIHTIGGTTPNVQC